MNNTKIPLFSERSRIPRGVGSLIPVFLFLIFLGGGFIIFFLIQTPQEQEIRVTAVIKAIANDSEFWEVVKTGMQVAANEFGIHLDIRGPWAESDVDGQIGIVEDILKNEPPTVLILAAADYIRLTPLVEAAVSAGIKVITMDSGVDSPLPRTFVATDNIDGGRKVANEMIRILEPGRKLVVINHVRGTTTAIDRERGVREVLEKDGRYPVIGTWFTDNFADRAYTVTTEILEKYPDLGGILTMNEISTIGAAQALLESGSAGKVRLVGFDNPLGRINLIEEGIIAAVIIQKPFNMGYLAVRAARDAAENRDLPPFIDTGSVLIRLENLYEPENQKLLFPFVE
jgi:ribose transport system substrate-binding protein